MSPWWQRRVPEEDAARAWLGRAQAATAAARLLVDQGFLPEAAGLAALAIRHAGRAALAHVGREASDNLVADFETVLVRPKRVDTRFLDVLREAEERRAHTERDPFWTPPGEEARTNLARATSFVSGIQALLGS